MKIFIIIIAILSVCFLIACAIGFLIAKGMGNTYDWEFDDDDNYFNVVDDDKEAIDKKIDRI